MRRGGQARWNSETQRWEDGAPAPVRSYTGPMPPRPTFAPEPGPVAGPGPGSMPGPGFDPYPDPGTYPDSGPYPYPDPGGGGGGGFGGPGGGTSRRTAALVAATAVAVIAASAYGGYLLFGHGDADSPPAAQPPSSVAQSSVTADSSNPQSSTEPSADPSSPWSPSPSVPAGYHLVHDAKGFTTAVPDGWQRSERPAGVFYTAPDERGLVQIFEITEPDTTPEEALRTASKGLSGNPGYAEISLGPMGGEAPGTDAAQLIYAYDSKRVGTRVKAVDCAFTAADGRQFAVLVLGTEAEWPQQERTQRIALQAFAPRN
ncbi:hypothetical protein ACFY12_04490 [Streptomyces sp. NPDC001339]|uniref:hypothetical protein n=1 Tax=Streptomyces sp. NPDC001339 TaxID=3364563 RepID=UPI003688DA4A